MQKFKIGFFVFVLSNVAFSSDVKFGGSLTETYTRQAQKFEDGTLPESLNLELVASASYSDFTLTGIESHNKDILVPENSEFQDAIFILSHKPTELSKYINVGPSISILVPMTKFSKDVLGLKSTVGVTSTFGLISKNVGLDNLILKYAIGYSRSFTQYNTKSDNSPVTVYKIRNKIVVGYKFTDNLSLDTATTFDLNFSSEQVVKYAYSNSQSLSYQFNDLISGSIGHSNGGSVYSIQGEQDNYYLENNIKGYSPTSSEFSISIGVGI